jgi:hypothetical protein
MSMKGWPSAETITDEGDRLEELAARRARAAAAQEQRFAADHQAALDHVQSLPKIPVTWQEAIRCEGRDLAWTGSRWTLSDAYDYLVDPEHGGEVRVHNSQLVVLIPDERQNLAIRGAMVAGAALLYAAESVVVDALKAKRPVPNVFIDPKGRPI